ncbi:retrovirus-related pol polyprotein from transposon TNT 1-94 [Tanacetum coccineum]
MLQRFNMPTQTIPMLSKKPKRATNDLHKDILGTRNPGLGYMAKRAQPVLYDADTLLHPNHHPVSIWDSEEVLVHQVVSMKKMNEKPGHVRPANDFYAKLNALMFVPQKDLSGDQAYWLSANEIASQASKSATPATPFVHKSRPPSQVLASLQKVNAVFPQFEGIIKERTTQKPDYVSEWCYDYAKQFVEQQLVPFYDHFKKHIQAANDIFFKEVKEYEQIFDELEAEYEQLPLVRIALAEDLRTACDKEHIQFLNLKLEISNINSYYIESEKTFCNVNPTRQSVLNTNLRKKWKPNEESPGNRISKPIANTSLSGSTAGIFSLVVQIVLWYLDSGCSRHMTGDRARLINFVEKFIGTVRFGNDEYAAIVGYGDYKLGDTIISRVYYVEGLKHNLFSVGQFCDGGLEVAFRQHSCHIRNYDMVDLLKGSRTTNLYSISLNDMMSASPVCLLTKASSTKSWLWHRRLNHLNFGTLNELTRKNLVRGLPMLKYDKDHLCPSCQLGKSKKASHPLKTENTNTEVLHTLHMDLCGPMRTESINGKKYVLVIVDDYTRFGWVRFLRTKDETPVIEKFIVKTQTRPLMQLFASSEQIMERSL